MHCGCCHGRGCGHCRHVVTMNAWAAKSEDPGLYSLKTVPEGACVVLGLLTTLDDAHNTT